MDIQLGVHMLNNFWTLKVGFGETLVMAVMMTKRILQFILLSFLVVNQGGVKTIMYVHSSIEKRKRMQGHIYMTILATTLNIL